MIVIKYRGGLGNQMFQYAFQIAVQKKYPDVEVMGDLSHYQMHSEHNGFELEKTFLLSVPQLESIKLRRISPYYVPSKKYDCLPEKVQQMIANNLQYKYYKFQKKKKSKIYYRQEYHNTYERAVFNLSTDQDWYLDGLWQDIRYFSECENEVRTAFQFKNENAYSDLDVEYLLQIAKPNSVGIHVRRGDFVNSKFDICSIDYYKTSAKTIFENIETPHFFIFTDDTEYVERAFAWLEPKIIIKHNVEESSLDMEMLSRCNHKIISNSTFAFWSAWLGNRQGSLVIAPRYSIIKSETKFKLKTPENWIQM